MITTQISFGNQRRAARHYEVLSHGIDHGGAYVIVDIGTSKVMAYKTRNFDAIIEPPLAIGSPLAMALTEYGYPLEQWTMAKNATETGQISTIDSERQSVHDGSKTTLEAAIVDETTALRETLTITDEQIDDLQTAVFNQAREIATLLDESAGLLDHAWTLSERLAKTRLQVKALTKQAKDWRTVAENTTRDAANRETELQATIARLTAELTSATSERNDFERQVSDYRNMDKAA